MKKIFHNISKEEKNRILEQHKSSRFSQTSGFKTLLESTLGNIKPLISENNKSSNQFIVEAKQKSWFQNKEQGDAFRQWVNKYYPKTAKKFDLDPEGKFDNSYIRRVSNYKVTTSKGRTIELAKLFYEQNPDAKNLIPKQGAFCQQINRNTNLIDQKKLVEFWKSKQPTKDPYQTINDEMTKIATALKGKGIPDRISCELALVKIRPGYNGKNYFVLDSKLKLLYLYDKNDKFIAQTPIISGENKQSDDATLMAKALMTWDEKAKNLGFEWDEENETYVDPTGQKKYNDELIYSEVKKSKAAFLPKGIYTTSFGLGDEEEYAGKTNNVLNLEKDGEIIAQAIHGYFLERPRTAAFTKAKQVLANPNDPKISQEFLDMVAKGGVDLSQSFGCINVPENFLKYLRDYGTNSFVFNMGEGENNYLVNNTPNFFDKMQNSQFCPSPQSLGAIDVEQFT
jgi:hypothetical protein